MGRTIAVSVFIGTATRAVNVAMARFTQWRQARSRAEAVSQAELEESYKGPKFDLAVRYGQHMQVGGEGQGRVAPAAGPMPGCKCTGQCKGSAVLRRCFGTERHAALSVRPDGMQVIFVVMTFSAGMPVLYLGAAISFLLAYWGDKYMLLKLCRQPVSSF